MNFSVKKLMVIAKKYPKMFLELLIGLTILLGVILCKKNWLKFKISCLLFVFFKKIRAQKEI